MNLTDARLWTRQFVADGGDSTVYSDSDVDRAIAYAGAYFCRTTRALKRADTVAISAGSSTFNITTPVTNGFKPERLIDCVLVGYESEGLSVISYPQLNQAAAADQSEGAPQALAFVDDSTAELWPVPDVAYSAKLRYWLPFTTFTIGTASPGGVTLNIPDEYLPPVLTDGAASVLRSPNKKDPLAAAAWLRFQTYCMGMRGAGNYGVKAIYRNKAGA